MTYFPAGGRILKRIHARYARLVTRDNNLFEVSKPQNISMMWAFLFALTGSTSVVTRYPGIQALRHHVLDRATPLMLKKMHSKLRGRE
jgi:hypothetical protein